MTRGAHPLAASARPRDHWPAGCCSRSGRRSACRSGLGLVHGPVRLIARRAAAAGRAAARAGSADGPGQPAAPAGPATAAARAPAAALAARRAAVGGQPPPAPTAAGRAVGARSGGRMGRRDPRPDQTVRRDRRGQRRRAARPRGSAFGYLGPNGAGKTTLIRTLLGLTRADGGTMSLLGIPVPAERSRALARVGAIVDEPRFHPHLTGRENLRLLAAARGGEAGQRIAPSLARVGLAERADDKVGSYSMGMRQRLGVAVLPAGRPRAAHPRRADERARPGRDARDAGDDRQPGRRGTDRRAVVAPPGRGRAHLRRGGDRRPRAGRPPGPHRRAGPRRGQSRRPARLR